MGSIIDLGFDVPKLTAEQKAIVDSLNNVYEAAKRLDGLKINFGTAGGFGDLQKATVAQTEAVNTLTTSYKKHKEVVDQVAAAEDKKHKTVISNSAAEVKAYQDSLNGQKNIKTTINETEKAYQKAANAAVAASNAQRTAEEKAISALKTKNSLIETATARVLAYKEASLLATDTTQLSKYNLKLQEAEKDLARLSNIGKVGFDEMGNATARFGGALGRSFGMLRQLAYIIPGLGIAGIFNLAFEAIGNLISKLDIFSNKLKQIEGIQTSIIKTRITGLQSAQEELAVTDQIYKASQNKNLSLDQQYKAYKLLQDKYPDYLENLTKEQFATAKTADNYKLLKDAIIAKAMAQANEVEIAKRAVQNQQLQFDNEVRDQALKRLNDSNTRAGSSAGTYNARTGALMDAQVTSRATEQIKTNNEAIAKHLEKQADNTKRIAVNTAIINGLSAETQTSAEKNGVGIFGDDKDGSKEKKMKTTVSIFKELQVELTKINADVTGTFGEKDKDRIGAYNKALKDLIEIGVKPASNYVESLQARIKDLSLELTATKGGKIDGFTSGETMHTEQIVAELSKKTQHDLEVYQAERHRQYLKEKEKREVETIEFVASAERSAGEMISAFATADFDKRRNQLSELENQQQLTYDAESRRIRDSSMSEQQKADQLSILENRRATEKEANARKEKQIAIEQAKFDQKMAAFQIFVQTLLTVAKLGFVTPAAILAGIAGAAAEVQVLAKQIPKYAEGTDNHPGGVAIVGEGKYKENVKLPDGRIFTADHAMMLDLPPGTEVTPLTGALNRSMNGGMAYTNGLTGMMERKHGDQAWKIAMWQTAQMKKFMVNKRPIVNVKISGESDYIRQQIFN